VAQGPKDDVASLSGPVTLSAGHSALQASSPSWKAAALQWPKSPGHRGTSLPQGWGPCLWVSPGSTVTPLGDQARIHKESHLSFLFPQQK